MPSINCIDHLNKNEKKGELLSDHYVHDWSMIGWDGVYMFRICRNCGVRENDKGYARG
ncbi:MAG: hypothetical protein GF349_04610 [Candidatus Magasanikbacteria bacterium]|nr:hypothetical protein [Candidatus Magasanikbacteria bacterium]